MADFNLYVYIIYNSPASLFQNITQTSNYNRGYGPLLEERGYGPGHFLCQVDRVCSIRQLESESKIISILGVIDISLLSNRHRIDRKSPCFRILTSST